MDDTATNGTRARRKSTALQLLQRVLATGWFAPDALARALAMSDAELEAYLAERETIPVHRQLAIAQFVIECIPPLARAGYQLRGQAVAAMDYQSGVTEVHRQGPPSRF